MPKPKRNKLEIYNDILSAIRLELMNGEAKPTRVQSHCNLAYDKFTKNLNELESRKVITQDPLVMSGLAVEKQAKSILRNSIIHKCVTMTFLK